jgi:hypothetical protein
MRSAPVDMVKQWRTTHFFYDMGGKKHNTLVYTDGTTYPTNLTPGAGVLCRHTVSSSAPGVDQMTEINIYRASQLPLIGPSTGPKAGLVNGLARGTPCRLITSRNLGTLNGSTGAISAPVFRNYF